MSLPLVIDAADLASSLGLPLSADDETAHAEAADEAGFGQMRLVDLRSAEDYAAGHIPGAAHGNAELLNRVEPPMGGLMPEAEAVNSFLQSIGANLGDHIVAYDAGNATQAARLMWVLDAYGYQVGSWLSGGFAAWTDAGYAVTEEATQPGHGDLTLSFIGDNVVSADDLLAMLAIPNVKVLDVRSAAEYLGSDIRSAAGGHVPGAIHQEWTRQLGADGRLLDDGSLQQQLQALDIKSSDTVIVYCQTHQRSAVTYVALKHLDFEDVRALDGAWSNWGNRGDMPKES